jgi:hypothetical protein
VDIPQGAWWKPDANGMTGGYQCSTSHRWTAGVWSAQQPIMVQVEGREKHCFIPPSEVK